MRHMAPILDFLDCMRRQVRFRLTDTTQRITRRRKSRTAVPCSRESEALKEPEAMQCPKIGRGKTLSKAKDLWHSLKCEAEERCQSIRICRNVDTQNLLVQLDSPSQAPSNVESRSRWSTSRFSPTCTRLDPAIYIRTRGSTGWSGLNSPAYAWRCISPAQTPAARTIAVRLPGSKYFAHGHRCELR